MPPAELEPADPDNQGPQEVLDDAADERDVAAAVRDGAADARDVASRDHAPPGRGAGDRQFAAGDRAAAAVDRHEVAVSDAAATLREEFAASREAVAAATEEQLVSALDRVANALGVAERALGSASALLRDEVATAREAAAAAAAHRAVAALERLQAGKRNAAALACDEAAEARDTVTAKIDANGVTSHAAADRVSSAADRVAAALDRQESATYRSDAAATLAQAYRDELTGALLRDPGHDQLSRAVDRAHRGEPLVIAFVDVDRLKWFNDTQGHASGDNLLRHVGQALRHGLRSYDLVVRYGGDEFVCALPGSQLAEAEQRFADISRVLAEKITGAAITAGFTELTENQTLEQAVAAADRDMYSRRGW